MLIAIGSSLYHVTPIPAHESGTRAVRLEKTNGDKAIYDVIRNHDNLIACDCPSYVMQHDGKGTLCKHGQALVTLGLIPAPIPIPNPPDGYREKSHE